MRSFWASVLMFCAAGVSAADTLTLRDGRVLQGTYLGGSPREIRMQVGDRVETFAVEAIVQLQFQDGAPQPRAVTDPGEPAPARPAAPPPQAPVVTPTPRTETAPLPVEGPTPREIAPPASAPIEAAPVPRPPERSYRSDLPAVRPGGPPRPLIWQDPGDVRSRDIVGGIGGAAAAPAAPFMFLEEDFGGTTPKIRVRDARGTTWAAKFGPEAVGECFASRMVWMVGYFVEPTYCIANGTIQGIRSLKRAKGKLGADGSFERSRFEARSNNPEFKPHESWGWHDNPFMGTPEFQGLKIMVLLMSNWDNKDVREGTKGNSNNGIFELHGDHPAILYEVIDWGGSMGKWGGLTSRSKYDCRGYTAENARFIEGVDPGGVIRWGYRGQHTEDATANITVADVRWLMRYLGQISDEQIRAGLIASAATPAEAACFQPAVRERIERLRSIAAAPPR